MWTALLIPLANGLIGALFPNAPGWAGELLAALLPALIDLVDEADEVEDLKGHDRLKWVVKHARDLVDDAFDDIPEWSALSEGRRDRIIGGLAELVLFINSISGKKQKRRVLRRLKKKA